MFLKVLVITLLWWNWRYGLWGLLGLVFSGWSYHGVDSDHLNRLFLQFDIYIYIYIYYHCRVLKELTHWKSELERIGTVHTKTDMEFAVK